MQGTSPIYTEFDWAATPWTVNGTQEWRDENELWSPYQSNHQRSEVGYRGYYYPTPDTFRLSKRDQPNGSYEPDELYDNAQILRDCPDAVVPQHGFVTRSVSPDDTVNSESSSCGYYSVNYTPKPCEPTSPEIPILSGANASNFSYMCSLGNAIPSGSDQLGLLPYPQTTSFVSPLAVGGPLIVHSLDHLDHFADAEDFDRNGMAIDHRASFRHDGLTGSIKPFDGDHHITLNTDLALHYLEDNTLPTPPSSSPNSPAEDHADAEWSPRGTRTSKRNAQAAKSGPGQVLRPSRPGRVAKSTSPKTNGSHSASKGRGLPSAHTHHQANMDERQDFGSNSDDKLKPFTCPLRPYGCLSRCASKNEWKRHITSQHFCLGYYRCDLCADADTRPNDFNRKDLFTQHLRRMHHSTARYPFQNGLEPPSHEIKKKDPSSINPKKSKAPGKAATTASRKGDDEAGDSALEHAIPSIQERCFKSQRAPPTAFRCAFCATMFEGPNCYDSWLEHVAKHMAASPSENHAAKRHRRNDSAGVIADGASNASSAEHVDWTVDEHLRQWLLQESLLKYEGQGFVLVDKNFSKGLAA